MTQHQLIIEYIKEFGSITPAKLTEKQRAYKGGFLGSETIRRCQELENHTLGSVQNYPKLYKKRTGKFMTFKLNPPPQNEFIGASTKPNDYYFTPAYYADRKPKEEIKQQLN